VIAAKEEPRTAGELIGHWRTRRRVSQLQLASDPSMSTKHLSFVENGRSRPSRQLLIHVAQQLDLPRATAPLIHRLKRKSREDGDEAL
jgi:transcriptional regulator with XRE-family HTH domain